MSADLPTTSGNIDRSPRHEALAVVLLLVLAVGCYINTLGHGFVYDDEIQILQNPYVKSWHYLPQVFRHTVWSFIGDAGDTNYYRPLMTLTYLFVWKAFGDLPIGYHLLNILLNALVVACVYYAGRELFRESWTALLAAILFAVHPVHTEVVDWIASVPDLEATLFCLLGFYVYAKNPSADWKKQAAILSCFLLALLAKEPALMLAPLLISYEHFVRDDRMQTATTSKMKRYLPVCVAGAAYVLLRIILLGKLAPVLQHGQITWTQAAYSAFALITQYARLLVWPGRLSAFHVFHVSRGLGEGDVLFGIAIVVGVCALAFATRRRAPEITFCVVWMVITLAPVLNARWMAANVLAERYLYLPSVGFCWLVGWTAKRIWDFLGAQKLPRILVRAVPVSAGIALVAFGAVKTWARNTIWRDDLTLYTATLETDPESYVIHMNLGISYFGVNFKSSEAELRRALDLKPDSPNVLNALGCVYLEQNRLSEAAEAFREAISLKPGWTDPHFNYGRLLKKLGQDDSALAEFRKAVEVGPVNATARLYLAQELANHGDKSGAEVQYRQSILLAPSLTAQRNLADILLETGRQQEAVKLLQKVAKEYPFDGATHLRLGRALESEGKTREARQQYLSTLETDPANSEARAALRQLDASNPH